MLKTKWIQKIDNIMGYGFKFLCFAVVFAIIFGFASSCFAVPAKALSVEDELKIQEYLESAYTRKNAIELDYSADEDGNRAVHLSIMGLQNAFLSAQSELYNDFSLVGDTFEISGSGYSGLYYPQYTGSDPLSARIASVSPCSNAGIDGVVVLSSPDFSIKLSSSVDNTPINFSYTSSFTFQSGSSSRVRLYFHDTKGFLSDSQTTNGYNTFLAFSSSNFIPTVIQGTACGGYPPYTVPVLFGNSVSYILPVDSFDTSTPWDYYNDTLLPYIRDNYNVVDIDNYLYFPDGYNPGVDPAPIVNNDNNVLILPPIIAGAGAIIAVGGVNFDISVPLQGQLNIDGIQFQFPKNDNSKIVIDGVPYDLPLPEISIDNHTIEMPDNNSIIIDGVTFDINADGSLTIDGINYPLPIGQPETMPPGASDYVMYYEIPTLERINIVDATVTKPNLDAYAGGMTLVWDSVGRILDASGYSAIIPILLAFAALYYLLFKVGGH